MDYGLGPQSPNPHSVYVFGPTQAKSKTLFLHTWAAPLLWAHPHEDGGPHRRRQPPPLANLRHGAARTAGGLPARGPPPPQASEPVPPVIVIWAGVRSGTVTHPPESLRRLMCVAARPRAGRAPRPIGGGTTRHPPCPLIRYCLKAQEITGPCARDRAVSQPNCEVSRTRGERSDRIYAYTEQDHAPCHAHPPYNYYTTRR